jgi:hypothetical protein
MVKLNFISVLGSRFTLGPAHFFRIEGATILAGPQHEPVARLTPNNQWDVFGQFFTRYDAESAAIRVCMVDGLKQHLEGPFATLFAAGNVTYADAQPLARFDHNARCWKNLVSQRCWPALLLSPAQMQH